MSWLLPPKLPSAFERFDTTATEKGRAVDVRTMQTIYNNHNILIARRLMRNVMYRNLRTDISTPRTFKGHFRYTASGLIGSEIMRCPIAVNPFARTLTCVIRAQYSGAASRVYGIAQPLGGAQRDLQTTYGAAVTAATQTEYTFSVPLPRQSQPAQGWTTAFYDFSLYVEAEIGASDKTGTGDTALLAGPNTFYGAFTSADIGKILVITGDTEIEPRYIVDFEDLPSGSDRVSVSPNWNKIPAPGLAYDVRLSYGVSIYDVSLYEPGMTTTFPQLISGL